VRACLSGLSSEFVNQRNLFLSPYRALLSAFFYCSYVEYRAHTL
jgi:hypothetical protein